ncbi:hypothetical protein [Novosphingobium humi]|uniref:hypothetical protein n=1 Tax=Novosphingobium humi TaxID=2282397 RepID=UPI0025B19B08|nr:hypothetical protein [Novosphingobium humi]WJS98223.1 hypothetical protein NYQ05_13980 [Novosphingobium humi]
MNEYKFTRIPDIKVIGLFNKLQRHKGFSTGNYRFPGGVSVGIWRGEEIPNRHSGIINDTSFSIIAGVVNYNYQTTNSSSVNGFVEYQRDGAAPFIDKIVFGGQFSALPDQVRFNILEDVIEFIRMAPPVALNEQGVSALDQTSAILNQITSAALALTKHSAEREKSLDAARDADRARVDVELAAEKARLHALHEEEGQKLDRLQEELEAKALKLDDRENTHVRRSIHKQMAELPNQFLDEGLLKKSYGEFLWISLISSATGIAILAFSFALNYKIVAESRQYVVLIMEITRVILAATGVGMLWYSISTMGRRSRQVEQWEQELIRFRLDVERASFLIEGDLEARKINQTGLPDVMLEAFSRGLFSNEKADHGSDQVGNVLAHLFSNSAKFKVGSNGVEAELNGKGIKKAEKEVG